MGPRSVSRASAAVSLIAVSMCLAVPAKAEDAAEQKPAAEEEQGRGNEIVVTARKRKEAIQDVPVAITAVTMEELTTRQVTGGPDLMTQVPNMTFTKTNFSGYSIQIRGIGTQAISATTDPAVAVAFNNTPFIRNRFFEQEFYDLERAEILRGPQGTLYGRNATAGVINLISAKPKFTPESKLSVDIGNYRNRRIEGMINIPLVEDKVALRLAGEWTKHDGYVTNGLTGKRLDGRDLWSGRASLLWEPGPQFRATLIYEHFQENDDRLRSGKQLCKKDQRAELNGVPVPHDEGREGSVAATLSQGCLPASFYSDESFQTPNGFALPYYAATRGIGGPIASIYDPYLSASQSRDLRVIEAEYPAKYRANSDILELQLEYAFGNGLTLASETGYMEDDLFSTQDLNRFAARPGIFDLSRNSRGGTLLSSDGVFCDPQLGCSDRLVAADLMTAKSKQFSQELRLASDWDGPFNFSLGANYTNYKTEDRYYNFFNTLTIFAAGGYWTNTGYYNIYETPYVPGVTDNRDCLLARQPNPNMTGSVTGCIYIDPNDIEHVNGKGHNYFQSINPFSLNSYAIFGETYYNITSNLKLTAGFRWTIDKKRAPIIPSQLLVADYVGYPTKEIINQKWSVPTGRVVLDWKPELSFTDDTLIYASYSHGYKAGGSNPPPPALALYGAAPGGETSERLLQSIAAPQTFKPEYVDAFEIGIKNTLFNRSVTLNLTGFYYKYKNYQISQIINRSALNTNYDTDIWGLEAEADWQVAPFLRLGFRGGYEKTRIGKGERAIDTADRAAGNPDWVVARPFPTVPSNCILPTSLITYGGRINIPHGQGGNNGPCVNAYLLGLDPVTLAPYVPNPTVDYSGNPLGPEWAGYPGFDPASAPNNGEGFFKDLSGNELPNAPRFTATFTADLTVPVAEDWLLTLHGDAYFQAAAWARIFNTPGYDRIKPYSTYNLALILNGEKAGLQVMAYVKNIFNKDAITGAYLGPDDTGLTTNVFLNEPRRYGIRVTKQFGGPDITGLLGGRRLRGPGEYYPLTLELGIGQQRTSAAQEMYRPNLVDAYTTLEFPDAQRADRGWGKEREGRLTWKPSKNWQISVGGRFGDVSDKTSFYARDHQPNGLARYQDGDYVFEFEKYHPGNYGLSEFSRSQEYSLVDFRVGHDITFGPAIRSTLEFGLSRANFRSKDTGTLDGMPDLFYPAVSPYVPDLGTFLPDHFREFTATFGAQRKFEGVGPLIGWNGSATLNKNRDEGALTVDWGVDGGFLFGRQKSKVTYYDKTLSYYESFDAVYRQPIDIDEDVATLRRNSSKTVPHIGGSLGLSYDLGGFKLGAGYRWERYFGVLDQGVDTRSSKDVTMHGPFFKLSIGFGK